MSKLFPCVLILLMLAASATYFALGDIRRGVYWAAGAILNISVTFTF